MDAAAVAAVTGGVDFATVVAGIGTIGAAVGLAVVATKGVKMLLGAIR